MRTSRLVPAFSLVVLIGLGSTGAFAEPAGAQHGNPEDEIDHTLILGVGGATELELGDGTLHVGANVMVEWDAIENWLELELSSSVLTGEHGVEVPADLLVKKPFRVARWFEFMVGAGPEVVAITGTNGGTYVGGEVALDFMFWPSHRFGLWLEPSYDFIFRSGVAHGLGGTGGLLIGW